MKKRHGFLNFFLENYRALHDLVFYPNYSRFRIIYEYSIQREMGQRTHSKMFPRVYMQTGAKSLTHPANPYRAHERKNKTFGEEPNLLVKTCLPFTSSLDTLDSDFAHANDVRNFASRVSELVDSFCLLFLGSFFSFLFFAIWLFMTASAKSESTIFFHLHLWSWSFTFRLILHWTSG